MSVGFAQAGSHNVADQGDGYRMEYAAALASAQQFAHDVLAPVLILLTPPPPSPAAPPAQSSLDRNSSNNNNNNTITTHLPPFGLWAQSRGVVVLQVHELSFQDLVLSSHPEYATNGAVAYYLRFDIPRIFEAHQTLLRDAIPDVCDDDQKVLYTDSDVLFVNEIRHEEVRQLKEQIDADGKFLMYGQDFLINRRKPSNTGVMWMDLEGFRLKWPSILEWGRREIRQGRKIPEHDQLWLNRFYADPKLWRNENALLPTAWNWKAYWQMSSVDTNDSTNPLLSEIKIVHFHGPKPADGLHEMASCDFKGVLPLNGDNHTDHGSTATTTATATVRPEYRSFVTHGICCDHGRTANAVLQLYNHWKPSTPVWQAYATNDIAATTT